MVFKLSTPEETTILSNAITTTFGQINSLSEFNRCDNYITASVFKDADTIQNEKNLVSFAKQIARDNNFILDIQY